MTRSPSAAEGSGAAGPVPPATRATTPGWRDPRLWIGVAIVLASVLAVTRLLAAADDTVQVWAVSADAGPGDRLAAGDLVARRVRFPDQADLDRYFAAEDELPPGLELTRPVSAGELLPRAAVGTAGDTGLLQVPIAVDAEQVPGSVGSGSVVDVYLVPSGGARVPRSAPDGPALSGVTVVDAPRVDEGFGTSGKRQLVLAVAEDEAEGFFELLGSHTSPVITVVRRG